MPPWLLILLGRAAAGEKFRKATPRDYRIAFGTLALIPICLFASEPVFSGPLATTTKFFPIFVFATILMAIYAVFIFFVFPKLPALFWLLIAAIIWPLYIRFAWHHLGVI